MKLRSSRLGLALLGLATIPLSSAAPCDAAPTGAASATATDAVPLVALFSDWRAFALPERSGGVVDYSGPALARKTSGLAAMRQRLAGLDRSGWSKDTKIDARLIEAEMNGLDFDLRIRQPWARDPSFYATVIGEQSDVPAHEGVFADTIDLFDYSYPLKRAQAHDLAVRLAGVPMLLDRARTNLAGSDAADLWRYGSRAFVEQEKVLAQLLAGTLKMRTLAGQIPASLDGAGPEVRRAAEQARAATAAFARWIDEQAPAKKGPSGVGKANYDWYMKNVQLVPYTWDEQVELLHRELERAHSAMRLEELRNRAAPPLEPIEDAARYNAFATDRMRKYINFVVAAGLVPEQPYYRAALAAQTATYTPPSERNFFLNVIALDPVPLYSHEIHWVELAKIKYDPNPDPIRRGAPLFNIYAARSEGIATAFEEVVMHAGFYDDEPRGRELVWAMLANRAARGLASLYVQANEIDLAKAGQFHAGWTPRGWSDPKSPLVGFEQLLYLRQPGYGTSYVTGKALLDGLIARRAHEAEVAGRKFDVSAVFADIAKAGILPWPLVEESITTSPPGIEMPGGTASPQ